MNSDLEKNSNEIDDMRYLHHLRQTDPNRRLRIIDNMVTATEEYTKKNISAIATGICFSGLIVATHFSGIDVNQAIQTEIQSLNSFGTFEVLKDFTPAMWMSIIAGASSLSQYIKHNKKHKQANQEFFDLMENQLESYQDVESQGKNR